MSTILYQSQKVTPIVSTIKPLDVKMEDQSITQKIPDNKHNQIDLLQQHRNVISKQQQQQQQQQQKQKQQVSMFLKNELIANESNTIQNLIQKLQTQQEKRTLIAKKKKVTFNTVQVREYARCLGDNPSTYPDGPSLSLDWMYNCYDKVPLNQYEQQQKKKRNIYDSNHKKYIRLDGLSRIQLIQIHTNCTDEEIKTNMIEIFQTRLQQQQQQQQQQQKVSSSSSCCLEKFQQLKQKHCVTTPTTRKQHQEEDQHNNNNNDRFMTNDLSIIHNKSPHHQEEQKNKKEVRFGTVQVREYARCLGDNPSCSSFGPSLSIDWMYNSYTEIPLFQYEQNNNNKRRRRNTQTKKRYDQCPLDGQLRILIIHTLTNSTHDDIERHMNDLDKVRRQREASVRRSSSSSSSMSWFGGYYCHRFFKRCKKRFFNRHDNDNSSSFLMKM